MEPGVNIFDSFYTTKEQGGGTGLGLAISYKIIKESGGNLSFQNLKTGGVQFCIELPRYKEVNDPKKLKILIADDEVEIHDFIEEAIEGHRFEIDFAKDGEEALRKFREGGEDYHLVISNIKMPKLDGLQLKEEIYNTSKSKPCFIFITAHPAAIKDNSQLVINKPFAKEQLQEVISKIIQ